MKMIITLVFILNFNISFAHDQFCYTHGDCQNSVANAQKCFIAKTGTNMNGEVTCAVRCINVKLGQFCQPINDEVFGYCASEKIPAMPIFNPTDPNRCDNAVDMFP